MNDKKRNCIFTDLPADSKLIVSSSKQNWTKAVPCTKEYKESRKTTLLTDIEFKLVELFIQKELALLRVEFFENKMSEIRQLLGYKNVFDIKNENLEIVEIGVDKDNILTVLEKDDNIIKEPKNKDIWNDE
jgi:hypothetical protein